MCELFAWSWRTRWIYEYIWHELNFFRWHLCSVSFSSMCRNTDHWLLLVRRELHPAHWFSLEVNVIGSERKDQVWPTCSILTNRSHGQNLRSTSRQAESIAFKNSTTDLGVDMSDLSLGYWPLQSAHTVQGSALHIAKQLTEYRWKVNSVSSSVIFR